MMKAVFFDLGNVLIKIHHGKVLRFVRLLRRHADSSCTPIPVPQWFDDLWGEWHTQFNDGRLTERDFLNCFKKKYRLHIETAVFWRGWNSFFSPWKPMLKLMQQLRSQYHVGLISNTNPPHYRYCREQIPQLAGLHSITLSYTVGVNKPDKQIYQSALTAAGVTPNEAVFIDDIADNIAGAAAIGMHGIQCISYQQVRRALMKIGIL